MMTLQGNGIIVRPLWLTARGVLDETKVPMNGRGWHRTRLWAC